MSVRHHLLVLSALALACFAAGCGREETAPESSAATAAVTTERVAARPVESAPPQRPPREQKLHPRVRIKTNLGDLVVELNAEEAPITVSNFLEYVNQGFYDGTIFHQVVDGYILLGGGFTPDLTPKETDLPIRNEAHNGLKNRKGTIAMARQLNAVDSSTSQFFINLTDNPALDHQGDDPSEYGYCVFGEVIEGFEALERISKVPVQDVDDFELLPVQTVTVESARILR